MRKFLLIAIFLLSFFISNYGVYSASYCSWVVDNSKIISNRRCLVKQEPRPDCTISTVGQYYGYESGSFVWSCFENKLAFSSEVWQSTSKCECITVVEIPESAGKWYGKTAVTYNIASPVMDVCPSDGDTTGGTPIGYLYDTAVSNIDSLVPSPVYNTYTLNSGNTNAIAASATTGTMYCLKFDGSLPTATFTYNNGWTNTASQNIKVDFTDAGGSGLNNYILQVRTSNDSPTFSTWSGWSTVKSTVISGNSSIINYTLTGINNTAYQYQVIVEDTAGNTQTIVGPQILKIDTTPPSASDISKISPFPSTDITKDDLLATINKNFQINVSNNLGSPINYIGAFFEDYSTTNSYKTAIETSTSGIWSNNEDIRNVDSNRGANGSREYSLNVSRICDEAGNCIGDLLSNTTIKTYTYEVYATNASFVSRDVTANTLDDDNIADGTNKILEITLLDSFGNQIVTASGINRKVDIYFTTTNYLYMDQYIGNGNGVFLTRTLSPTDYENRFLHGSFYISKFLGEISNDGKYRYNFKVYSPTYNAGETNGQELVNTNARFIINNITFAISGTIGSLSNTSIIGDNFSTSFKPIYYTKFTGELQQYGIVEGAYQNSIIEVTKNGSTPTSSNNLYIEFGSGANLVSAKLDMKANLSSGIGFVGEGNNTLLGNKLFKSGFTVGSNTLNTIVTLTGGLLEDIEKSYISTHISYVLDLKNIVYNSKVIGKTNYLDFSNNTTNYLEGLKVIGKSHSVKQNDLSQNQNLKDIHILGKIEKSSLKQSIVKNVYSVVKYLDITNGTNVVNDLSNLTNSSNGGNSKSKNILYFGDLNGANVEINSNNVINGKKSIVAIGGNIYIKEDIIRDSTTPNAILGIISLKDANGKGGNIYIDPSVKIIEAALYADKSLISYNGVVELDGDTNQAVLKNQLYIYGSVFSENTIGGSRVLPNPICPYYIKTTCDLKTAQKYDLNYLRRYYVKLGVPINSGSNYFLDYNGTGISYNGGGYPYYGYPIVIKYNSNIQTSPPPFFEITK